MVQDWMGSASRWIGRETAALTARERAIVEKAAGRRTVARDLTKAYAEAGGLGGRVADRLTGWAGSWTFILLFLAFLVLWTLFNAWLLGTGAFDPYPFVFLNLILSMLAAIQAPIILMAQNRQAERDRIDARHDYEVNLKAEIEIMSLHEKIDAMRREEIRLLGDELSKARSELAALRSDIDARDRPRT